MLVNERPSRGRRVPELYDRAEAPPQLLTIAFRGTELDARDRLACADFVAGVAIEHHSRGVVDDVVGFLAAGTEVDGEHAGLVGVDERDVAAARRFHLDRFARLRQMRGIAALRGDPFLRLRVGTAGAER